MNAGRTLGAGGTFAVQAYDEDVAFQRNGGTITGTIAGALSAGGAMTFDVSSRGFDDSGEAGGSATGGTIGLTLNGGSISGSTFSALADAIGGTGDQAGNGTGGTINVTLNGGALNTSANVTLSVNGTGGAGTLTGGVGQGGTAVLTLAPDAGSGPDPVLQATAIALTANGAGGQADCFNCYDEGGELTGGNGAAGGAGFGGTARVAMSRGTLTAPTFALSAIGTGANGTFGVGADFISGVYIDGGAGGAAQGGLTQFNLTRGTVRIGQLALDSSATGGTGGASTIDYFENEVDSGNGGGGGAATGGTVNLFVSPTTSAILQPAALPGSTVSLTSRGSGGFGGGSYSHDGGNGASGAGGAASVQTGANATVGTALLTVNTLGVGGNGGSGVGTLSSGGDGQGGNISLTQSGGTLTATTATILNGSGQRGGGGGNNGTAAGGSTPTVGASAFGPGGVATGALVTVSSSAGTMALGDINATATAYGQYGEPSSSIAGGSATGGQIVFFATPGTIGFSSIVANASASGATGTGSGGDATGGQVTLGTGVGGQILGGGSDYFSVSAVGGGANTSGGTGGAGSAGTVTLLANGGPITLGTISIDASAAGGSGENAGLASAGNILIGARAGGDLLTTGGVTMLATRQDGIGYVEGFATGGSATIDIRSGSVNVNGPLNIDVSDLGQTALAGVVNIQSIAGTGAYSSNSFGATTITANGNSSGRLTIRNDAPLGFDLIFASLVANVSGYYTPAPVVLLTTSAGRIYVTDNGSFAVGGNFGLDATGSGGLQVGGTLSIASNDLTITHATPTASTVSAGTIDFQTGAYTQTTGSVIGGDVAIDATTILANSISGGNSIDLTATSIDVQSARVTGAATYLPDGTPTPGVASLTISSGAGGVRIRQRASANGGVAITAIGDLTVDPAALIRTLNRIDISVGGSVVLGAAASVTASDTLRPGVGSVSIAAGDSSGSGAIARPIYANGASITGAASVSLLADVIETTTSTLGGGAIDAQLRAGSRTGDASGLLSSTCQGGNICMGAINATGAITIGTAGRTPTGLLLAGNIAGASLGARAGSGITLGQSGVSRTFAITGPASLDAGGNAITGFATQLNAGSVALQASLAINDPALAVRSAGDIAITTSGGVIVDSLIAGGRIGSATFGALSFSGPLTVRSTLAVGSGTFDATAPGGITLGRVQMANGTNLRLDAGTTALTITDASAGPTGRAATASLRGASVTVGSLATTGSATLTGTRGAVIVSTDLAAGRADIDGTSIALNSIGAMTIGTANARSGPITLIAGGAIGAGALITPGNATLTAGGAISVTSLAAGGSVTLAAVNAGITATAPGRLTLTSATAGSGGVTLTSTNDLVAGPIVSSGGVTLTSSAGSVTANDVTIANGNGAGSGGITTQAIATGDLVVAAAQTATFNGTETVRGAISGTAPTIIVNGVLTAPSLSFASRTITIGNGARIGALGTTNSVNFRNTGTSASTLGGSGTSGYTIAAAALSRIQASAISFDLPATGSGSVTNPDVTLAAFTVNAAGTSANLPATGTFTIRTPGRVQVAGAVAGAGFADGNTLRIEGGQGIDVITPAGSLLLTGTNNTPGGSLELLAPVVRVGTAQALADVAAASGVSARDARLAINDGAINDQGYLQANRLLFQVANAVYVQNSGGSAFVDRRGLTVGPGGLLIGATGTGAPEVILNGRTRAADGTFTTGGGVGPLLRVSGISALAAGSAANGCSLFTGCPGTATPVVDFRIEMLPQQDVIGVLDDADDDNDDDDARPTNPVLPTPAPLIQIAPPVGFAATGNIDPPVLGAGNDVLWVTGVGGDLGGVDAMGLGIGNGTSTDGPISTTSGGGDRGQAGTSFGVGTDRGTGSAVSAPGAGNDGGSRTGPQGGTTGGQEGRAGGLNGAGGDAIRTQDTGGVNGTSGTADRAQGQVGVSGTDGRKR